jgi:hypothetical protein
MANAVNRVFDSSGPEGKVRGTPQQIIEKYMTLFRDSQLSGDRVAAENFQQHAEHYIRLLSEALKEQNDRKEQQEAQAASRRSERTDVPSENLQNVNVESPDGSVDNNSQISKPKIVKGTEDAEATGQ